MTTYLSSYYELLNPPHCCVCSGVCHHIPPAQYCAYHRPPARYAPSVTAWPPISLPPSSARSCSGHCYCRTDAVDHKVCCNCGNRQKQGEAPATSRPSFLYRCAAYGHVFRAESLKTRCKICNSPGVMLVTEAANESK